MFSTILLILSSSPAFGENLLNMENITTQIMKRYFDALGAEKYLLRIVHANKQAPTMGGMRTPEELIKQIDWLKHKNVEGYQIYCRPMGWQYVLLDDLNPETLKQAKDLGPAVVMETSPNNYQAWLKLANTPESREEARSICLELANMFGADTNSAEPDHVGRVPGYTNRKEKYKTANGFPYVRLLVSKKCISRFSPRAGVSLNEDLKSIMQKFNKPYLPTPKLNLPNGSWVDGVFIAGLKHVPMKKDGSGPDRSLIDFNVCCMMIRQGKSDSEIRAYLETITTKQNDRKDDYIGKTIANARKVAHPNTY